MACGSLGSTANLTLWQTDRYERQQREARFVAVTRRHQIAFESMIGRHMEGRRRWWAVALAALLPFFWVFTSPGGARAPAAWASSTAGTPISPVLLPPSLQALEQKMEGLQISSERYSRTARGAVTITTERKGPHGKRTSAHKRTSLHLTELGEASLSPDEGQVFTAGHMSRPSLIAIGSTLYSYSARMGQLDGGRPWLRISGSDAVSEGAVFPYHRQPREVDLGGSGSYANLINMLATALSPVNVVGPATVDGQQTTEFTARVEPLSLIKGLTEKEREVIRQHLPHEELEVFITESGLPLRVTSSIRLGVSTIVDTTDILAVNIPIKVMPPPARRTISAAEFAKLVRGKHKRAGFVVIETGKSTSKPATLTIPPPPSVMRAGGRQLAEFKQGRAVTVESGCLACHRIGSEGNTGPGPALTHIGSKLSPHEIEHALIDPSAPMPSFKHLPRAKFKAVVEFLSDLRKP